MCLVEIDGAEPSLPSCNTPATPGMDVRTKSDRLKQIRRTIWNDAAPTTTPTASRLRARSLARRHIPTSLAIWN